jgi:predicted glycoside hydrolase/deacetylase ChbG (UPF0249 family)
MLIINADDLGRSVSETDAALDCYRAGRVTSVTAMVFMNDSERAAQLALANSISAGLHLNLTESFAAVSASSELTERHERVARFLTRAKYSSLIYNPTLSNDFRYIYETQIEEFIRLYGRPPSHIDGHQHQHLCANMLLDGVIPRGLKVRRTFHFWPGEKSFVNRTCRKVINRLVKSRYSGTDYFFALVQCLERTRMEKILELGRRCSIELMTHPANPSEREYLLSEAFGTLLNTVELGDYEDV